jgi:hypothetical protein
VLQSIIQYTVLFTSTTNNREGKRATTDSSNSKSITMNGQTMNEEKKAATTTTSSGREDSEDHRQLREEEQEQEEQNDDATDKTTSATTTTAATGDGTVGFCAAPVAAAAATVLPTEHDNDDDTDADNDHQGGKHATKMMTMLQYPRHRTSTPDTTTAVTSHNADPTSICSHDDVVISNATVSATAIQNSSMTACSGPLSPVSQEKLHSNSQPQQETDLRPGAFSIPGPTPTTTTTATTTRERTNSARIGEVQEEQQQEMEENDEDPESGQCRPSDNVLVQAELVPPTVHAVSVVIDEEDAHHHHLYVRNNHSAVQARSNNNDDEDHGNHNKQGSTCIWSSIVVSIIIVIMVVLVVVIPNNGTSLVSSSSDSDDAKFDYPCFISTKALIQAQVDDFVASNFTRTADRYIVCPGTKLKIGVLENPAKGNYSIVEGDNPLMVVAPDTTVQCGIDGHRNNSCILDGGFVQVMMQTQIPGVEFEIPDHFFLRLNMTVRNVTIRGFTFTGITKAAGSLSGVSLLLSQTGNVTVEDCRWTDMTASSNVILAGQNAFQDSPAGGFTQVPTHSADLTLRNCHFDNIVYDAPMILSVDQIVHVDHCTFTNISTSALPSFDCDGARYNGGCSMLMACMGDAECSVTQSCFENIEITGPGLLVGSHSNVWVTSPSGSAVANDPNDTDATEIILAEYNNYLDETSRERLRCEVAIINNEIMSIANNNTTGVFDHAEETISISCLQGLAFEAQDCQQY